MKILTLILMILPFTSFAQEKIEPMNRDGIVFTPIMQKDVEITPTTGKYGFTFIVKDSKGSIVSDVIVKLVDVDRKIRYQTIANRNGEAKFMVDSGSTFEVDVEKNLAIKVIKTKRVKYGSETIEIVYKK